MVLQNPGVLWQSNTQVCFPAVKKWVNLRMTNWKKKLKNIKKVVWMSLMSNSHWWYLFYREVNRSWDSFKQRQFQTPVWKRYLWMHPPAERFVLGANDLNFWKEGVRIYLSPTWVTFDRYWLPLSGNEDLQHQETKGSARRCIWRYHFSTRVWNIVKF